MPTVLIDTTTSPNQIAIKNMAQVPLGTYSFTVIAKHMNHDSDSVKYTLNIVVVQNPCLTATLTVDPTDTVFEKMPLITLQ